MRVENIPIVTNGNMASTITSTPIRLDWSLGVSVQAVWVNGGSAPNGNMSLQASLDGINWTVMPSTTLPVPNTASTQNNMWNIPDIFYNWIQFIWVPTSGSGTLQVRLNSKGQ
jgi:hypothetical protein